MSTQYQSGKDVPTEVLAARLNELADVVARKRDRIGDEFTMRIPAECDRDADLVMSEAAVRLEALQAECNQLRKDAERYRFIRTRVSASNARGPESWSFHYYQLPRPISNPLAGPPAWEHFDAAIDAAMREAKS